MSDAIVEPAPPPRLGPLPTRAARAGVLGPLTGLAGPLLLPAAASSTTAWVAVLGHAVFGLACVLCALGAAAAGRPGTVAGWAAWFVVCSAGLVTGLHVGSWDVGGVAWIPAWLVLLLVTTGVGPALVGALGLANARRTRRVAAVVSRRRRSRRWPSQDGLPSR